MAVQCVLGEGLCTSVRAEGGKAKGGMHVETIEQEYTTMTLPSPLGLPCPPRKPMLLPDALPKSPRRGLAVGVG